MADTPTADSLQIEIVASSDDAIRKINRLAKALEKLKAATTGFGNVAKEISDIGAASGAAAESTGQRNTRARKEALNRATSSIKSRTITSDLFPGTKEISLAIDSAIKKYDKFVGILEQTRGAITRPAAEEYLREIRAEQDGLNKILEQVNSGIGQTPKNITTLQYAAQDLKGIEDTLSEIWSNPAPENINWDSVLRQSEEATKAIENDFASAWENIKEKFSGTILGNLLEGSNSIEDAVGKLASLDDKVTILKIRLDGLKEKLSEAFEKGNISQVAQYTDQIRKLREEIKNLENPTEKAEKATGKFQKLLRSIKHIAVYRMIRDALTAITDGLKEGVDNLYQYSAIMDTDFAPSMDRLATSSLYLKNSLGALAGPIIQSLVPAIELAVDWFVELLNGFNQLVASLSGKTTYTKAIKYWTEYAESTDKAAKSVKNFMLGIDELNVINDQKYGAGAGADLDYEKMFMKDVPIENTADLLGIVSNIGAALLAWNFSKDFLENLPDVTKNLGQIDAMKGLTAAAMIAIGAKWSFDAAYDIARGTADITTYVKGIVGVIAKAVGGAMIGNMIAPGAVGTLAGLGISLALGLTLDMYAYFKGSQQRVLDEFYETPFGQQLKDLKGKIEERSRLNLELKARIDSITGEIDPETIVKLGTAKQLIEEIFTLDAKNNKTSTELELLKQKIDVLNGLQLPGVFVEFDEATKRVRQTKEELQGVIDKLLVQYQMEALKNAYIESFRAQYDATMNVRDANLELADAINKRTIAQEDAKEATENYNAAQKALEDFVEKYDFDVTKTGGQGGLREQYNKLAVAAAQAKTAMDNAQIPINEAQAIVDEATKNVQDAMGIYQIAVDKVSWFSEEISNLTLSMSQTADQGQELGKELADKYGIGLETGMYGVNDIMKDSQALLLQATQDINGTSSGKSSSVYAKEGRLIAYGLENGIRDNTQNVTSAMDSMGNDMVNSIKKSHAEILNSARRTRDEYLSIVGGLDTQITIDVDTKQKATGKTSSPGMKKYASGGFPETGQMFIARERGPELVGNIGQKTAVVNNEQIISGISQGVENANEEQNALLREQNELLRALLQKDTSVVIGNKAIKRAYDTATRQSGASIMAGGVVG